MMSDQMRSLSHQLRLFGVHANFEKRAAQPPNFSAAIGISPHDLFTPQMYNVRLGLSLGKFFTAAIKLTGEDNINR